MNVHPNSTHAAWANLALGIILAALPVVTSAPGLPSWLTSGALLVNAALHATLPDAPKGTP